MSWFLAFVGFALLIIFHELGHFTAAKAVGMRVERFSLFFPPLAWKVRRGETEYAIGTIPLGGYVKISGMSPREELPAEVAHRAYYRQPVWKRIVVIGAGPAVNFLIAFVLIAGIFAVQGTPENSVAVNSVAKGTPAVGMLQEGDKVALGRRRPRLRARPEREADRAAPARPARGDQQAPLRGREHAPPNCPGADAREGRRATRDGQRRTLLVTPRYDTAQHGAC